MYEGKIQITILDPVPKHLDVIFPVLSLMGARHATNAINPPEAIEMVLAEIPIERDLLDVISNYKIEKI